MTIGISELPKHTDWPGHLHDEIWTVCSYTSDADARLRGSICCSNTLEYVSLLLPQFEASEVWPTSKYHLAGRLLVGVSNIRYKAGNVLRMLYQPAIQSAQDSSIAQSTYHSKEWCEPGRELILWTGVR